MLRCEECGAEAEGNARGWAAYRFRDPDGDRMLVVVYCPACARRELGDPPELSEA